MSDNIEFINEQSLDVKIAPTATDYVRILDASDSNKSKLALISELPSTSSSGGDLVSTNNLSDVANAATAFGNIKQAATESATGVVELATTSEATTGTDTTRAVTPAGVKAVADTKANSSHSHAQSDVTNLTTDLAAKAPIASPTFTGTATTPSLNISGQTASRIAILDGSKNLISANTSTYPSLAELEYVKGVTSAIQTQIDAKASQSYVDYSSDTDLSSFISRLSSVASYTMTHNEVVAHALLIQGLKSTGLWSKIYSLYTMPGASASSQSIYLKGASNITWYGSPSFSFIGVKGDGATSYGDTGVVPSSISGADVNSFSFGAYIQAPDQVVDKIDVLSSSSGTNNVMFIGLLSGISGSYQQCPASKNAGDNSGIILQSVNNQKHGLLISSRTSSSSSVLSLNGHAVSATDTDAPTSLPNRSFRLLNNWDTGYSSNIIGIFFVSSGLSTLEIYQMNSIVCGFLSALGRYHY